MLRAFFRRSFGVLPPAWQQRVRRIWAPSPVVQVDWSTALPLPSSCVAETEVSNPLLAYFESHLTGRGIWKWRHYFEIYHRHLRKFVGTPATLLEIGVYSGGSLEMWRDYLGERARIVGVDIEEACKVYEEERVRVFIGDQADRDFWRRLKSEITEIDVVIDDGGHQAYQQVVTLEELLPHLRPGGVFICEDLPGRENRFVEYVKEFLGDINDVKQIQASGELRYQVSLFQKYVASVHFYPLMVVIERVDYPEDFELVAPKRGSHWQPFFGP